jgi:hypothetical protein
MRWNSSGDVAMETNRLFEPSDTWTEEDCLDVTTFSLQYAASIIHSDPEILGGTPVFISTRVPMKILLDCLEGSDLPCGVSRPFS